MSVHSFPKIDQKEYLKKYLSGDKVKKKKKDKKHKKSSSASVKVKIIDDDINNEDNGPEIDEELLLGGEDAPQIVGEYIEEQPADRKVRKWKSIVVKDEPEDEYETDLWGKKSEFTTGKKLPNKTLGNSPLRKNERKCNTSSGSYSSHQKLSSAPSGSQKRHKSFESDNKNEETLSSNIKTKPHSPIYRKRERREREIESSDESPPRRRNSDQSPPRKVDNLHRNNRKRRSSDLSPPRKTESSLNRAKKRSDYQSPDRNSDQSPPRRYRNHDQTPTIRKQHVYESSFKKSKSPTKNYRRKSSLTSPNRPRRDSDQSPPRRNKILEKSPRRHGRNPDQSPARRSKRRNSDQFSTDESPPRKSKNFAITKRKEFVEESPTRRRKKSPFSASPSHIKREKRTPERSRWVKLEPEKSLSPPPTHKPKSNRTLEGKKVGLQDAKSLQKETVERRKQEDLQFEKMSSEVSGRNAEVRVRANGRKGRRAIEAANEDPEERRRKEAHEEKKKILYERWGKGLKQIEAHEQRMLEQKYESSKPLARYSNDEDLERHLKEQERAEDPMLQYMRQKRKEKEKISGKPQIPRYEGPYPENRFGIRPGYRWDGVDRSNGYEKKYFAVQSERQARQDEAYKFSVEDM